jgi:outer membrane murein-binding lipoprotein Lpp
MNNLKPLVIAALLLCAMSLWGCNQQKTGSVATKIRELETRYSKLEEDYRTLHAASEQTRKRLAAVERQRTELETEKADLVKQLESASSERDAFKTQVTLRTAERDAAQNHLMQFSKDLQALAGRIEATVANPSAHPSIIPASRRSE